MNMSLRKSIGLLVSLAVVFSSCGSTSLVTNGDVSGGGTVKQYDGKTIFQGLVFGDGPVAKQFPEVWETDTVKETMSHATAQELRSASIFKGKVMDRLTDSDPTFFDRFGTAMASGDPLQVSNSLDQAAPLIKKAMDEVGMTSSEGVVSRGPDGKPNCFIVIVAVAGAAIEVGAAIHVAVVYAYGAVVVAVAAVVAKVHFWSLGTDAATNLTRDVWTSRIAQRLLVN